MLWLSLLGHIIFKERFVPPVDNAYKLCDRKQKTSFETYFVEQVIPKANNGNDGNERVLAYFEQKKNMQAFLKSPYMNSKVEDNELFLSNPKIELLYLLMENLQALIEKNLLAYLTIKPAQACDDSDEQNENMQNTDKVEAYVFLLYSMANKKYLNHYKIPPSMP